MRLELLIPHPEGPEEVLAVARDMMRALVRANLRYIRRGGVPRLYKSGVRYIREPEGRDVWTRLDGVIEDGGADCECLVAWRAAELIALGEVAKVRFERNEGPDGRRQWHVVIERANGAREDPSHILGM